MNNYHLVVKTQCRSLDAWFDTLESLDKFLQLIKDYKIVQRYQVINKIGTILIDEEIKYES